jgi:hypothetical protein
MAVIAVMTLVGAGVVFRLTREDDGAATAGDTPAPVTSFSPLTGLPIDTSPDRSAVVVKIDSHPSVTTFPGLQLADLVYEVLVEGGITRYLAVFQSQDADPVGPVRSLRSSDFDLAAGLGRPIVVFSGANQPTLDAAASAAMIPFSPASPGSTSAFRRDPERSAPHNLLVSIADVRAAVDEAGSVRAPFVRPSPGTTPTPGDPIAGLRIVFSGSSDVLVEWDPVRGEWLRSENGRRQTDDDGRQLGTAVVVVLFTDYTHPPWDRAVPEAVSVGAGDGIVLAGGAMTSVRWKRPDAQAPFELSTPSGEPVALPAGRMWVELAPPGTTSAAER